MSFVCNHNNTDVYHGDSEIIIYPNFIFHNGEHIYSHESLHYGLHVYIGGDVAVERAVIDRFTAEFIFQGLSVHSFVNSLNQEAFNKERVQFSSVDPHMISHVLFRYLYIQMHISMGNLIVRTPSRMSDYDLWAWKQIPEILSCFTYLWMNHDTIIGRCGEFCSKSLVIDGHQKCRRRLCGYKNISISTEEMANIVIGCCRTPVTNSKYCSIHDTTAVDHVSAEKPTHEPIAKSLKRLKISRKRYKNDTGEKFNAANCRTEKERSDDYLTKCSRSFGLIALVYNCKIIGGFSELFRSETLKEIINLFCSCIRSNFELYRTFQLQLYPCFSIRKICSNGCI